MSEVKLVIFKKGFNYSQDGPGNRLVYHLVGCNMKCPWCSNSDGMDIKYLNGAYEEVLVDDIVKEAVSCKRLFFSGGGVTFTGGECTLQLDALKIALIRLKEEGINTCIETNASSLRINEILEHIDYLICDFKHYDDKIHSSYTGISNKTIKRNIERIASKRKILVRVPLINNFNASLSDIVGFLDFFKHLNQDNLRVEFLKYHEYGKNKWEQANREYKISDGFITDEVYKAFIDAFKNSKINIINT